MTRASECIRVSDDIRGRHKIPRIPRSPEGVDLSFIWPADANCASGCSGSPRRCRGGCRRESRGSKRTFPDVARRRGLTPRVVHGSIIKMCLFAGIGATRARFAALARCVVAGYVRAFACMYVRDSNNCVYLTLAVARLRASRCQRRRAYGRVSARTTTTRLSRHELSLEPGTHTGRERSRASFSPRSD